jgi:hypothetical protein
MRDAAGFAADAAKIGVAGRPGGNRQRGGGGGAGGEERQHVGDVPFDGVGAGARAGFGDHAGGKIAGENGASGVAGGEVERGKAGATAEVEERAVGQGGGQAVEQAAGGVLQVQEPGLVVIGGEPIIALGHMGGPHPAVAGQQADDAPIEPGAIQIALEAHGN